MSTKRVPKKGASRKLAAKLKALGDQTPPQLGLSRKPELNANKIREALRELEPSYIILEMEGEILKLWVISEKFEDLGLITRFRILNMLLEKHIPEIFKAYFFVYMALTLREYGSGI